MAQGIKDENNQDIKSITTWERIYDKIIKELKVNLIYVLVLALATVSYKTLQQVSMIQRAELERIAKDRDEWRVIANKAISRNFDYVDILIKIHEANSNTTNSRDTVERQ